MNPQYQQFFSKLERMQKDKFKQEARSKSRKKDNDLSPYSKPRENPKTGRTEVSPAQRNETKPKERPDRLDKQDRQQATARMAEVPAPATERDRVRSLSGQRAATGRLLTVGSRRIDVIRTLGAGTFGRVKLVRVRNQTDPLAMKVMPKSHIIALKQVEHIKTEKKLLSEMEHPFVYSLKGTFQDELCIYMLFELCPGGELFSRLRKDGRFSNDIALFYSTEILLALAHMHGLNIVYRDLKPENILIDRFGHVKIADFGFAKKLGRDERTFTLCGTPEYLAPEIIHGSREGYGKSADWWALGVLVYQLLTGHPPFYDLKPLGIYQKILKGIIEFPHFIKSRGKDLIRKLLNPEKKYRLGCQDNGLSIQQHKWFKGVDWEAVRARRMPSPWTPPLKHQLDTSCFQPVPQSPRDNCQYITAQQQKLFEDF